MPLGQKSATGDSRVYRGLMIGSKFVLFRQTNRNASDFVFDAVVFGSEEEFDSAFLDPTAVLADDWSVGVLGQFAAQGIDFVTLLSRFVNFEAIY